MRSAGLRGLLVIDTRRWRAPAEDGGVLVDPPFADVPRLLEENRTRLTADSPILGRPLREWRRETMPLPTVACGHQPELFHPGVWIKNFAVNGLARRHGLHPLNLVIVTDTIKSTTLRIPVWVRDPTRVQAVELPFDDWTGEVPYISRRVINRKLFVSFAERAWEIARTWGYAPLLPRVWDRVIQFFELPQPLPNIAECFFAGRRFLEQEWGCVNDEQMFLFSSPAAEAVTAQILDELPRFHQIYNDSVRAYRRQHGLRSRTHPVPDLAADGDLLEAPFWLHNGNTGRRSRLMARLRGDRLELYGHPGSPIIVARRHANAFADLRKQGLSIEPRALMTTMFARLFLCELFIHGIGGAKYDRVTDEIIRRYFGVEPPHFMVISGTLRLPLPAFPATPQLRRQLQRERRDLHWNPQRYIDGGEPAAQREQLLRWGRGREQFRALRRITEQMRTRISPGVMVRCEQRLAECDRELAANAILQRRDYAFVLYPEETLRPFCTQFLNLA